MLGRLYYISSRVLMNCMIVDWMFVVVFVLDWVLVMLDLCDIGSDFCDVDVFGRIVGLGIVC